MAEEIVIRINAQDNASDAFRKVSDSLKGVGKQTKDSTKETGFFSQSWVKSGMAMAGAVGGLMAVKAAVQTVSRQLHNAV